MKRSELKATLKPLIKQCIAEVLLEEGLLSSVISEVVVGLNSAKLLAESNPSKVLESEPPLDRERERALQNKISETRKRMTEAIGREAYGGIDIFEGTKPLSSGGSPGAPKPSSPLAGVDPADKGVDIMSALPGIDKLWKRLI